MSEQDTQDRVIAPDIFRHSWSHLLAQAVQRDYHALVHLGIGPAIDNGFYYDILLPEDVHIKEDDLGALTKTMHKIAKENQPFHLLATSTTQTKDLLTLTQQPYKLELMDELVARGEAITFYANSIPLVAKDRLLNTCHASYLQLYDQVTRRVHTHFPEYHERYITFIDMCAGPHVTTTKDLEPKACALTKLAGAYWKGNEQNVMMTRIYGVAFAAKAELTAYMTFLEEAKKRDHRILGKQLDIYSISDLVGAGFPLLHPNGMIIRKEIEDYLRELHKSAWYQRVRTPHLAKVDLYKTSGHYDHYKENFQVTWKEENFMVKPMNCPHHMQIFAAHQFSYRDMPVRYFEPATVYRDEKSWQLSGLTRVRAITQDDGHLFCRTDQIADEVGAIVDVIKTFYTTLGMIDEYWVSLSVRDESDEYMWSAKVWEQAEQALTDAAQQHNLPYTRIKWEAAFYGPKLDFMFKDVLGREWQLATIQCDFNLPERFDLSFTNAAGDKERPVVIHRAISGSLERFMGVMIEHFAGAFPVWLAPTQAIIIPVADAFLDYAAKIHTQAHERNLRVRIDTSHDSLSKKIRNAELQKIPYILIVGEKEQDAQSVSVRVYKTKEQYTLSAAEFLDHLHQEYTSRSL